MLNISKFQKSRVTKEMIEEFGKLVDLHNQLLVEEKCRKYSIVDSEDQTSIGTPNTQKYRSNSKATSKIKYFNSNLKASDSFKSIVLSDGTNNNKDLKLQEHENLFKSPNPRLMSFDESTQENGNRIWSFQKTKRENPFRSKLFKSKLSFVSIKSGDKSTKTQEGNFHEEDQQRKNTNSNSNNIN